MGQLPYLLDETKDLRKRDDFAVFTVAYDNPDREKEVDRVIREKKIPHVVVWDHREASDLSNKADWNIKGFPTTVLVNPDGVIQASIDIDENLEENLLYFLGNDNIPAPIGLSIRTASDEEGLAIVNDEGMVTLSIDLYSPTHEPLEVSINASGSRVTYDEENDPEHQSPNYEPVDYKEMGLISDYTAEFGDYGSNRHEIALEAFDNMSYVFVSVNVKLPGTQELNDGEGLSTGTFAFVRLPQTGE